MSRPKSSRGRTTQPKTQQKTEAKKSDVVLKKRSDEQRNTDAEIIATTTDVEFPENWITIEDEEFRLADDPEDVGQALAVLRIFQVKDDTIESQRDLLHILIHPDHRDRFLDFTKRKVMEVFDARQSADPDAELLTVVDFYSAIVQDLLAVFKQWVADGPKE